MVSVADDVDDMMRAGFYQNKNKTGISSMRATKKKKRVKKRTTIGGGGLQMFDSQ